MKKTLLIILIISIIFINNCIAGTCGSGCLNGGTCNSNNNQCTCTNQWTGDNCSTKKIQVYSIFPSYTDGGEVIFYGWFTANSPITILIGSQTCTPTLVATDQIKCNIGAGNGVKDISITQAGYTWFSPNSYEYVIRPTTPSNCPTNCSNRGYCGAGRCVCDFGYWGDNCQLGNGYQ
ncbi:hypothetical protein ACTFIZ_003636 [Dictyostelium cf. discoideum]